MPSRLPHIGQSSLFKNALLNLIGMVVPALVALVAIPLCIRAYGDEQFGLLSLSWTFLVSFAFLDLGMGIGTTKHAAEILRTGRAHEMPAIVWSSIAVNALIGIVFASLVALLAPTISDVLVKPSPLLRDTSVMLIEYVAMSIPFITSAAALRGVLESSNRFDLTNAVKVPSSSLLFLIPAIGALVSLSLPIVVLLLTISRVLTAFAFWILVSRLYPDINNRASLNFSLAKSLMRFGRWIGLSSLLNPVIHQGEKVLIPALFSVSTLTYYVAPQEMVARLAVIPFSLAIALLPKLSFLGKEDAALFREQVFVRPAKYLLIVMAPLAATFIFFSRELLTVWLGASFVARSGDILVILASAYFFNAFAYIGFSALQGLGRPELKATLDLILAPCFVILSWLLMQTIGPVGAAWAKLIILAVDAVCLLWMLKNVLELNADDLFPRQLRFLMVVSGAMLVFGVILHLASASLLVRGISFVGVCISLGLFWWNEAVTFDEQQRLRAGFLRLRTFFVGSAFYC